jgi:hypothetical protein
MKINVIETMHNLSKSKYEELYILASKEGVKVPTPTCSKVELITLIIANRAENGDNPINERTRYRFREWDGTEHYVMLTPEQERFMRWNHDNAVNYDRMDIDVIENIDWETP